MTAAQKKVIDLPVRNLHYMSRRSTLGRRFRCRYCGYPSATKMGRKVHVRMCHTDNDKANRNWEIFYLYREEGKTVPELAMQYKLSPGSVYRIIQRGLAYPGIYELEGGFR